MSEDVHPSDWEWINDLLEGIEHDMRPDSIRVDGHNDEIQLVYEVERWDPHEDDE